MINIKDQLQSKAREIQSEAQGNLKIVEELAGLEKYISETYVSRVFYELIQNADDCQSSRFVAKSVGDDLYFLNDGNVFTSADLESICRSAFSTKQRGTNIGYRGIGFKSTAGVAHEIAIYSGDLEVYFSKEKTKELFASTADVPLLRVPHWGSMDKSIEDTAKELLRNYSCVTCFVLRKVNEEQLLADMKGVKSNSITFLRSISSITIDLADDYSVQVRRTAGKEYSNEGSIPCQDVEVNFKSIIGKQSINEDNHLRIWHYKNIAISTILGNDGVPIRLPKRNAYAQAFLPMLTVTGLGAVINADFSTDPSRTRIATDGHTKKIMEDVIELLSQLLQKHIGQGLRKEDCQLLEIIIPYHKADILDISPSVIASIIKDYSKKSGIEYSSFLIQPDWMAEIDYKKYCTFNGKKELLFDQLNAYDSDNFFGSLGACKLSYIQLFDWLSKSSLSLQSTMNLTRYIHDDIRDFKSVQALEESLVNYARLITCSNKEIKSAAEINEDLSLEVDQFSFEAIVRHCGTLAAFDWYSFLGLKDTRLPVELIKKYQTQLLKSRLEKHMHLLALINQEISPNLAGTAHSNLSSNAPVEVRSSVVRMTEHASTQLNQPSWRKAELIAIDILLSLGVSAKDVSKRNCGCDLIGVSDSTGEREIFIEVKLLESANEEFRITDNEIFVAKERGSYYWILLIVQPDKNQPPTQFSLIKDAYNYLAKSIDRRCVKYESFCSDYAASFSQIIFK